MKFRHTSKSNERWERLGRKEVYGVEPIQAREKSFQKILTESSRGKRYFNVKTILFNES